MFRQPADAVPSRLRATVKLEKRGAMVCLKSLDVVDVSEPDYVQENCQLRIQAMDVTPRFGIIPTYIIHVATGADKFSHAMHSIMTMGQRGYDGAEGLRWGRRGYDGGGGG